MNQRVEVAAAVIERPDGTFLMACRPEGKAYAGWWEFPGGKVEAGETARDALVRELQEELGIAVTGAYPWISRFYDYPHAQVNLRFFRVTAWQGEPHPHEGQKLAWTRARQPEVEPILPANGPILRGLSLPLVYAISDVEHLGTDQFLRRLDERLSAGLRLVQLREKQIAANEFAKLARIVADRCHDAGAQLLLNGNIELASALHVGVHLTSKQLAGLKQRPELSWVAASCHNAEELALAVDLGVDFAVLSPVLPTASHPGADTLGWLRFAELMAHCPIPVFALGGLTDGDLDLARCHGAHGIALKGRAWG